MGSEVLDGKYALDELLGRGGMGEVHAGRNLATSKRIAIKRLLHLPKLKDEIEARAASALEHANVVQIFDVAQSDGALYMVMELLRGESLTALIEREAPMPAKNAAALLLPVLAALHHAHSRGVIHRDLKPDNIFLSTLEGTDGVTPKLLDFGIAKLRDSGDKLSITRTDVVMGSPLYMSPEQTIDSGAVDARADVYAIGVILYELLSAHRPFDAASYPALIYAIMQSEPRPLAELVPFIAPAVSAVVRCAMAHDREARFESAEAFAQELRRAVGLPEFGGVSSAVVLAPRKRPAREALGHADTLASVAPAHDDVVSGNTRAWWAAVGVTLVLALAGGAYALVDGRGASTPVTTTTTTAPVTTTPIATTPVTRPVPPVPSTTPDAGLAVEVLATLDAGLPVALPEPPSQRPAGAVVAPVRRPTKATRPETLEHTPPADPPPVDGPPFPALSPKHRVRLPEAVREVKDDDKEWLRGSSERPRRRCRARGRANVSRGGAFRCRNLRRGRSHA